MPAHVARRTPDGVACDAASVHFLGEGPFTHMVPVGGGKEVGQDGREPPWRFSHLPWRPCRISCPRAVLVSIVLCINKMSPGGGASCRRSPTVGQWRPPPGCDYPSLSALCGIGGVRAPDLRQECLRRRTRARSPTPISAELRSDYLLSQAKSRTYIKP